MQVRNKEARKVMTTTFSRVQGTRREKLRIHLSMNYTNVNTICPHKDYKPAEAAGSPAADSLLLSGV